MLGVVFFGLGNAIVVDTTLTGPQIAFWRYLVAAGIYSIIHLFTVGPLRWADLKVAAATGVALSLEIAFFFMSLKNTTVANTTLIGTMTPLVLFVVAARRFGEKVSRKVIAATAVAFLGVAAVVLGSSGSDDWSFYGDLLAAIALLLYALYFALGKVARQSLGGLTLQTHILLVGTPVLLAISLLQSGELVVPQGTEWRSVLGLVALPTTGHFLINWAHRYVTLTLTSLLTLGVPVVSVLAAVVFLGDSIGGLQLAGAAVVLMVLAYAIVETSRIDGTESAPQPAVSTGQQSKPSAPE